MSLLLLRLCCLFSLVFLVSSKAVRDLPYLNSTISVTALPTSTGNGTPRLNPHLEKPETGFLPEETPPSQITDSRSPAPAVIVTPSATDQDSPWTTAGVPGSPGSEGLRPRPETTAPGFEDGDPVPGAITRIATPTIIRNPVTVDSRVIRPTSVTNIQIGDKTLSPGGETVTIGTGSSATQIHIDPSGQPIVVVGSSTSTHRISITVGNQVATLIPSGLVVDGQTMTKGGPPVIAGSATLSINNDGETIVVSGGATSTAQSPATQTLTFGGITATAVAVNNQFVVGSSTLAPGKPVTVDGTIMSLTTNAAGSTVLVAGTLTTTLPAPTPANNLAITTNVMSGTTQYIVNSQTLFPGNPITVNGTPMSIIIASGTTILIVGEKTTTISGHSVTPDARPTSLDAAALPPGYLTPLPNTPSTSTKSGAGNSRALLIGDNLVVAAMALAFMSFG